MEPVLVASTFSPSVSPFSVWWLGDTLHTTRTYTRTLDRAIAPADHRSVVAALGDTSENNKDSVDKVRTGN